MIWEPPLLLSRFTHRFVHPSLHICHMIDTRKDTVRTHRCPVGLVHLHVEYPPTWMKFVYYLTSNPLLRAFNCSFKILLVLLLLLVCSQFHQTTGGCWLRGTSTTGSILVRCWDGIDNVERFHTLPMLIRHHGQINTKTGWKITSYQRIKVRTVDKMDKGKNCRQGGVNWQCGRIPVNSSSFCLCVESESLF